MTKSVRTAPKMRASTRGSRTRRVMIVLLLLVKRPSRLPVRFAVTRVAVDDSRISGLGGPGRISGQLLSQAARPDINLHASIRLLDYGIPFDLLLADDTG